MLMLRTCNEDMSSYNGFVWPEKGLVEAPDWNPEPVCGGGLHGLPKGVGDGSLLNWDKKAKWLVFEVDEYVDVLEPPGKAKAPKGNVVYCGDRKGATDYILEQYPDTPCVGCYKIDGDRAILTGGYKSTLTGGNDSTLTGGDYSTLTGGNDSTLTGEDFSTLTGGHSSTLTGGYGSTLTSGDWSTLTGGHSSTLIIKYWEGTRYRIATAYVGENDILSNTPYRFNGKEWEVVK